MARRPGRSTISRTIRRVWIVTDEKSTPRRDVIAVFNWSDKEQSFDLPLDRLGLPGGTSYVGFDYWADTFVKLDGGLKTTLPRHACAVISVRPAAAEPFVVGTSRHITGGMIDLHDERWGASAKTLSGRSDVVGGDPYEVRIVAGERKVASVA